VRRHSPRGFAASRLLRWLIPVHLGVILLFIAGCGSNSSILDPQGPTASKEATLFWIILGVATFVFVAVEGVLIYSVIRFRDRPGAPEPRQIAGNTRLEIVWTIVPSFVLFVVLGVTISTLFAIQEPAGQPTIYVNAFGHQWWWEFRYFENAADAQANAQAVLNGQARGNPAPDFYTADDLVVPVTTVAGQPTSGTVVHVNLISDNVIHSFWIPQLSGKTDVIPGHMNHMWFTADKTGTYEGACAEFCGDQHAHMRFRVIAETMDDYNAWVQHQEQPASEPGPDSLAAQGKQLFFQGVFLNNQACISCHSIFGTSYNGVQAIGQSFAPNLTHFGSRDLIAGGVLTNTPDNLAQWLTDPQSIKPGSDMPYLGLSQPQVQALVAYLESLQ